MIHEIGAIISLFADDEPEDGKFWFRVTELIGGGLGFEYKQLDSKTCAPNNKSGVLTHVSQKPHCLGGGGSI